MLVVISFQIHMAVLVVLVVLVVQMAVLVVHNGPNADNSSINSNKMLKLSILSNFGMDKSILIYRCLKAA